jgi:hypothetical protein
MKLGCELGVGSLSGAQEFCPTSTARGCPGWLTVWYVVIFGVALQPRARLSWLAGWRELRGSIIIRMQTGDCLQISTRISTIHRLTPQRLRLQLPESIGAIPQLRDCPWALQVLRHSPGVDRCPFVIPPRSATCTRGRPSFPETKPRPHMGIPPAGQTADPTTRPLTLCFSRPELTYPQLLHLAPPDFPVGPTDSF